MIPFIDREGEIKVRCCCCFISKTSQEIKGGEFRTSGSQAAGKGKIHLYINKKYPRAPREIYISLNIFHSPRAGERIKSLKTKKHKMRQQ